MTRIGLFGGSFNPIHVGHLIAARAVAEHLRLTKLYLVPAAVPPHRTAKNLAAPHHRLAMLQLAAAGEPLFEISDYEINQPGPRLHGADGRGVQAAVGGLGRGVLDHRN